MVKGKDVRITIILECNSCRKDSNKESPDIFRYITKKNRHNTPIRLELRKFCRYCYKHKIHGEINKIDQRKPRVPSLQDSRKMNKFFKITYKHITYICM